jgi:hypothetical protein
MQLCWPRSLSALAAALLARMEAERPVAVHVTEGSVALSLCTTIHSLIFHFPPYLLTYMVPLFLKRQCDRTLGARLLQRRQLALALRLAAARLAMGRVSHFFLQANLLFV